MFAHEEGDTQTTLYLLFKRTGTDQPAQVFSGLSFVLAAIHDMRPFRHTSPSSFIIMAMSGGFLLCPFFSYG